MPEPEPQPLQQAQPPTPPQPDWPQIEMRAEHDILDEMTPAEIRALAHDLTVRAEAAAPGSPEQSRLAELALAALDLADSRDAEQGSPPPSQPPSGLVSGV